MIDRLVLEKLPPGTFGIWVGVGLLSMLNASLGLHGTRIEDPYLVYAVKTPPKLLNFIT